jgi:hypothetical protein
MDDSCRVRLFNYCGAENASPVWQFVAIEYRTVDSTDIGIKDNGASTIFGSFD